MPHGVATQIILFLNLVVVVDLIIETSEIRASWTWEIPHIIDVYHFINYDIDLQALCRMSIDTFNTFAEPLLEYMDWPRNWDQKVPWSATSYPYKKQKCVLSPKSRILRTFMIGTGRAVTGLVSLFGQQKSTVYLDFKFVTKIIVKVLGADWLTAPDPNSAEYDALLGAGVFSENGRIIFINVPWIVDVMSIPISRPTYGQKSDYNGHKKQHTKDFQLMHSGKGRVYHVTGPQPGSRNDIQIARNCELFRNPARFLRPGHGVFGDLAYFSIGYPYVTRFAFQAAYTPRQIRFNSDHSKVRVISENLYGRFKSYFPMFSRPWTMKIDDIGVSLRAFIIATNVLITIQSPLRRHFN